MEHQIQHFFTRLIENPSDIRPLYDIEHIFAEQGAWSELAEFLFERSEDVDTPELKAVLLVRAGEIVGFRLGDAETAEALFQRALEFNGSGGVQFEAQVGILSLRKDWSRVLELCKARLDSASTPTGKAEVLHKMGQIYRDRIGDKAKAMKAFQGAFKTDNACYEALEAARNIYAEVENWKLVVQLYQLELQQLQKENNTFRTSRIFAELGDVLRLQAKQDDKAAACYNNAIQLDARNVRAREGLVILGYDVPPLEDEAPEPAAYQGDDATTVDAPPEQTTTEMSSPQQEEYQAEDAPTEAVDAIDRQQATGPPTEVMDAPEPAELQAAIDAEAGAPDTAEVDTRPDGADTVEEPVVKTQEMESPDEGAAPEDAEADAQDADAVEQPGPTDEADAPDAEVEAQDADEPAEEEGTEPEEAAAEDAAAEEEVATDEAPGDTAEETSEQDSDAEGASEAEPDAEEPAVDEPAAEAPDTAEEPEPTDEEPAEEPAEEEPAEEEPAEEEPAEEEPAEEEPAEEEPAEEEEADDTAWLDQVAALRAEAQGYGPGPEAVDTLRRAIAVFAENGPAHPDVVDVFDELIAAYPDFDGHYQFGAGIVAGNWEAIRGIFEKHAAETGSEALRGQVFDITLYELGDVDAAAETAAALGRDQEIEDARMAASGGWRKLQQELNKRHSSLGKEEKAYAVYGRIAALARGLDQTDRGIDALRHLVGDVPSDQHARRQLKALYASAEKWNQYIELVKEEVNSAHDDQTKSALLRRMVEIYRDKLKLDVMVINTYNQILQIDPENRAVLLELADVYEANRRFPDLIGALQKLAELASTEKEQIKLNLRIANLFLEKFNNQAEAIKAFEAVLELDPTHETAIDFLKQMYERRRDWEKLIDVHEKEIATIDDPAAKGERFKEVAKLATERLRKPPVAIALWLQVLQYKGEDLEALSALEQLYERDKNWEALAEVSERKLGMLDEDKARMKLAEKLGRLYSERLSEPERAIEAWKVVLSIDANNRKGQDSLKRLLIDARDWDALQDFYSSRDDFDGYVRILETLAGTIKEDEVKIDLLFRSAAVWQDKLDQTDRAVRSLERILSIHDANVRAAQKLAPIYEANNDSKKLVQVLDIILGHLDPSEDPDGVRETLRRMANLQEHDLRNPQQAFAFYAQAFALTPLEAPAPAEPAEDVADEDAESAAEDEDAEAAGGTDEPVAQPAIDPFADLERVAEVLGCWDDLVGVYLDRLQQLEAAGEPNPIRELRLRVGRILNSELGRVDEALDFYEAVLAEEPDELRALAAEEEIFQKTGRWDRLMEVHDRRLALTQDGESRIQILLAKATILEEQNGAFLDAVGCYQAVIDLDPEHLGALQALHRLYELLEDYASLADIIRREIELTQAAPVADVKQVDGHPLDPELAESSGLLKPGRTLTDLVTLKLQLGLVAAAALGDEQSNREAVEAFTDVLAIQPEAEEALVQLEELGRGGDLALEVANTLEPLYEEHMSWEQLVAARETQLQHLNDDEQRVAKLLAIGATLVERMSDFGRAFEAYGRALQEDPTSVVARERLEQISDATDAWASYVDLLESITVDIHDPTLRHEYLTRVASTLERLGETERAQEAWRRVLDLRDDDESALAHLEALYSEGGQWHELLEIYQRQLDLAMNRVAEASAGEDQAAEGDEAAEGGEAAEGDEGAEGDEDDVDTGAQQGDNEAAAAAIAEVEGLRFKMAALHEDMLDDAPGAIDIYRTILDASPSNIMAAKALERLLGNEGRFDELSRNLQRQLELVEDEDERLDLRCRLASLYQNELGQIADAIDLYAGVLETDPENAAALAALEGLIEEAPDYQIQIADVIEPLYRDRGDWHSLIKTHEIRIDAIDDPSEQVRLLMEVASLWENQLGELNEAFVTVARAVVTDVRNETAMAEMYRLTEQTGMYYELVDVLESQVAEVVDFEVGCDLNMRIAAIQEGQLGDIDGATAHYRRVLELAPDHMDAIDNLERIYSTMQAWPELVEILLTKVSLTEDADAQRDMLHRAATIYEEMLEQPDEAIGVYQRVLAIDEFDPTAIEALERLFLSASRWTDLIELYNRKIRRADSDDERKELYFVIGAVYETEILDNQRAIDTYRAVLEIDEADGQALEALDRLYEQTEQWDYLLETLEQEIKLANPEDQLDLRFRMGSLWEKRLYDPLRAIETYRGILEQNPEHGPTTAALEGMIHESDERVAAAQVLEPIYRADGQWQKLIDVYELLNETSDDPLQTAARLKEIGQIYENNLGHGMAAFAAYGRCLAVAPDDEVVLDVLERLAAEHNVWEDLVALLEEQLGSIVDYEAARNVALRIGRVLEIELADLPRAIDTYRKVLEFDPASDAAIKALDRLYEREGQWENLADILQQEIMNAEEEDEQIALRYRLGVLYESALEDVDSAIRTYHDILLTRPEHAEALEALERMFSSGFEPMKIGEILEPIYRERAEWEKLADVFLVQLDHKDDSDERFVHLQQIAELYRNELADNARAFLAIGQALKERPGDVMIHEELEKLAEQIDAWDQLSGIYADALEAAVEPDDQQRLWYNLARVLDERLGAADEAEQAYRQVLDMDDADQNALEALDRIYLQQSRWADLAGVLHRRIELTLDEMVVIELSYRLGMLYEQQLGDLDMAVATYRNILDINPVHEEALLQLENIYLLQQSWEPLFDVYERQAELSADNPDAAADKLAQMANLADQMLMRPLDAIDLWTRVLDIQPENQTALASLAALYDREERHSDLVSILERQLELIGEPLDQIDILARIGRTWVEHLYDEQNALDAYRRLLEIDPDNVEALFAARELYQRTSQYEELVEVVERIIALQSVEPDDLKELFVQLGEIQGDLLVNVPEAIKAWTAVLDLDPSHRLALDNLERLHSEEGNWEATVDILDRKVQVLEAVGNEDNIYERIELLLRIADMWENKIGQRDMAISSYEAVLELDPGHMQASRALEALYTDKEAWDKLVELLLTRNEYVEDEFDQIEILRHCAQIYEEHIGDAEAAFLVLCRAFLVNYENDETARELERLARVTGSWEELIALYYNQLEELDEPTEQMILHNKIARWFSEHLNDLDRAIHHLVEALRISPDNLEALEYLQNIYERTAKWSEFVEVMRRRANLTPDMQVRVDLLRKMGDVYDIQLENREQAVASYREILTIDDADVLALESLEKIHQVAGEWHDLIDVLSRKAAVIYEPDQVIDIKFRIAELFEHELADLERAVEAYRDVLTVDQTHRPSLHALERLYERLERWHELLDIYDLELSLTPEPAEQIDTYAKIATVYEHHFDDADRAVEAYGKILLNDPSNINAILELERLYEQLQRWNELVDTYERHVEAVTDNQSKVDLFSAMGVVHRDYLHDIYRAIECYQRILEIDPANTEALYELAALYETASDWDSCLRTYEQLSNLVTDVHAGVEIHYRMGRILEENLADQDRAEERYRYALEVDPSYMPAIDALRGMYERREDWQGVILMLKQEEEYTQSLEDKANLLARIGQIYEHRLGDQVSALDYYEQTIELAPQNVDAAEPLANMYLREKRWERAEPLLDLLVRTRSYDRSDESLYLLHFNLGLCCEELGQDERALKEYREAYELNPNHLQTLLGLGRLHYRREDYERAFKVYHTVTVHHPDSLEAPELLEIYFRCGDIKLHTGDRRFAQQMFEKALELDPYHAESLKALVDLHEAQGDWERVVDYKRRQLQNLEDPERQFAILVDIGDLRREHFSDAPRAIEAYHEALQLQPYSVAVLRKLLDLHTHGKRWPEAIQTLLRIIENEQDNDRLAKYYYTVAVIYRDELNDEENAVAAFNQSLDANPLFLKAFEAIDRILTANKEWKELERAYRKMLHRIKDAPTSEELEALKLLLWKNLGEIYRTRQRNYPAAIESYRIAVALAPQDTAIREILADLYERTGSNNDEAIEEHKQLIAMSPFRIQSYRALFTAYMKSGKYDEAWCMAAALSFLQNASKEEEEFYQRYLGQNLQAAKRALSTEHWKLLYSADQDMLTSNIMAIIAANLRDYYAFDLRGTWSLHKRKDLLDPNQQIPFCKIFQYATRTLGVNPPPRLFLKRDGMVGMQNANVDPPALILGPDMFQGRPDRELGFIIGKWLALARPEHYLAGGFFPTENLKVFFMAAMQISNPALRLGQGNDAFADVVKAMTKMPPPMLNQLRKYMEQFFKTGQNPNLSKWLRAVDDTTNRAGLLLCGDLRTAANCIKNEPLAVSKASAKDKIKSLVVFSISDEYFQLRKDLGLALGK